MKQLPLDWEEDLAVLEKLEPQTRVQVVQWMAQALRAVAAPHDEEGGDE